MSFAEFSKSESPSQRRAKIVATLGPASNTETVVRDLVRAGVDIVRLNFSHGSHERKLAVIETHPQGEPRRTKAALHPRRSTGTEDSHRAPERSPARAPQGWRAPHHHPARSPGTASLVGTTFKTLAENVEQGSRILLSDGLIELRVHEVLGDDISCDIVNGGMLGENKGINLPGIPVRVPSLTDKDTEDLEFALKNGVDAIAVSFVRTAEDVRLVRNRVAALGFETWIIAKLEKPQAIEHLDAILQVSDGIMVARGDLGVEVPPEMVPAIQKHIIRRAAEYAKPVITATQMLESMIENPRPTRAEVSDVANAVYDGTDAVMLSGESAVGKYPVETVAMMARIVSEAERDMKETYRHEPRQRQARLSIAETICEATAHAADDLDLRGIALFTESGRPRASSPSTIQQRPSSRSAPSRSPSIAQASSGAPHPSSAPRSTGPRRWSTCAESLLEKNGYVRSREVIAIVAGTRTKSGSTNFMRLHVMGDSRP